MKEKLKLYLTMAKAFGKRFLRLFLNDTIYSVIGVVFGVINAFVHYFGDGDILKSIFWILCALVCIMNLKETPK